MYTKYSKIKLNLSILISTLIFVWIYLSSFYRLCISLFFFSSSPFPYYYYYIFFCFRRLRLNRSTSGRKANFHFNLITSFEWTEHFVSPFFIVRRLIGNQNTLTQIYKYINIHPYNWREKNREKKRFSKLSAEKFIVRLGS